MNLICLLTAATESAVSNQHLVGPAFIHEQHETCTRSLHPHSSGPAQVQYSPKDLSDVNSIRQVSDRSTSM
jgi:hypothetical protein